MMKTVALQVARWGNSLTVRLPAAYARRAGIHEGDRLELQEEPDGTLSIKPSKPFDRVAFIKKLKRLHASMPVDESVIEQMRREARY